MIEDMIEPEAQWIRAVLIHPSWVSPSYWRRNDQKIVDLDIHNARAQSSRDAKKAEVS